MSICSWKSRRISPSATASAFAGRPTTRSAPCDCLQILVVHLRHFSGYLGGKVIVRVCAFTQAWRKEWREDTMQLSRGKLVASFAAVTLGGVLLAALGVAFTSST